MGSVELSRVVARQDARQMHMHVVGIDMRPPSSKA
jgi:hypothetical protein